MGHSNPDATGLGQTSTSAIEGPRSGRTVDETVYPQHTRHGLASQKHAWKHHRLVLCFLMRKRPLAGQPTDVMAWVDAESAWLSHVPAISGTRPVWQDWSGDHHNLAAEAAGRFPRGRVCTLAPRDADDSICCGSNLFGPKSIDFDGLIQLANSVRNLSNSLQNWPMSSKFGAIGFRP